MKIKTSFITNSSTTSFVMFAFSKTLNDIKNNDFLVEELKPYYDVTNEEDDDHPYNVLEALNKLLKDKKSRIKARQMYDYEYIYFGINPNKIEIDETRRDALITIANESNAILNFFVKIDDFKYYEEAWRDC